MRKICSKVLLLSDNDNFVKLYQDIAIECEVNLRVASEWNEKYRINEDVIICGSKYLPSVNKAYYENITLILKTNENFTEFLKMGINDFIFDHTSKKELMFAFTKAEKQFIKTHVKDVEAVLKDSLCNDYIAGNYEFYFSKNRFFYKGEGIHLPKCYQLFLIEWLLNGNKDNSKRPYLHKMRKSFGKDFLKDVDKYGQIKELKNE